ncbi:MAG: hypothetical protein ACR2KO_13475 [Geodermatophilaceae bacterium]
MRRSPSAGGVRPGAGSVEERPEIGWLFGVGNDLGSTGAWAFLVASAATALLLLRRSGRRSLPGAVLLVGRAFRSSNRISTGRSVAWRCSRCPPVSGG